MGCGYVIPAGCSPDLVAHSVRLTFLRSVPSDVFQGRIRQVPVFELGDKRRHFFAHVSIRGPVLDNRRGWPVDGVIVHLEHLQVWKVGEICRELSYSVFG